MVGLQGDEDVRVGGADDAGRAVHPVDAAVRHPDVVDDHAHLAGGDLAPNRLFNDVGQTGGLFDASSGLGPQVQGELPTVGVREEVLAESRREQEGRETDGQEHRDEHDASADQQHEQSPVGEAATLEPMLERLLRAGQRVA